MIDYNLPIWNGVLGLVGTIIGLVLMYLLKPWLDKNFNRETKTFGVIYDKKFLLYNSIIELIFESKDSLIGFLTLGDQENADICMENIAKLSKLIKVNRLLIDEKVYIISNYIVLKLLDIYNEKEANRLMKTDFHYYYRSFIDDLISLENIMRKKLNIKPL